MQIFTEIDEDKTLQESRELLLNNDKSALSDCSGNTFPTKNLQVGMNCYRTDIKKLYKLVDLKPTWVLALDFNSNDSASAGQAAGLRVENGLLCVTYNV